MAVSASSLSGSRAFVRDKAAADAALLEAQQKVTSLAAIAANFQSAPLLQASGPAFKPPPAPLVSLPVMVQSTPLGYKIPRKESTSVGPAKAPEPPVKHSSKHHSKHAKSAKRHKKHSKKHKSVGKPKKDYPSQDSSSPTPSVSSSSEPEAPKIDEATAQVLCSGCCKYTAQPAFVKTR